MNSPNGISSMIRRICLFAALLLAVQAMGADKVPTNCLGELPMKDKAKRLRADLVYRLSSMPELGSDPSLRWKSFSEAVKIALKGKFEYGRTWYTGHLYFKLVIGNDPIHEWDRAMSDEELVKITDILHRQEVFSLPEEMPMGTDIGNAPMVFDARGSLLERYDSRTGALVSVLRESKESGPFEAAADPNHGFGPAVDRRGCAAGQAGIGGSEGSGGPGIGQES